MMQLIFNVACFFTPTVMFILRIYLIWLFQVHHNIINNVPFAPQQRWISLEAKAPTESDQSLIRVLPVYALNSYRIEFSVFRQGRMIKMGAVYPG